MATITIQTTELARLATIVGPSAGKDRFLPVFTYLQISSHEGKVEFRATDRYTFAAARGTAQYDGPDTCIRHADVKHLLSALKMAGAASVTLEIGESTITATAGESQLDEQAVALSIIYQIPEGEFPKFNPFRAEWTAAGTPSFNPEYLRHVPNIKGEAATFASQGEGKPCGFFGADWAVIIMPIRISESPLSAWIAPKPVAA